MNVMSVFTYSSLSQTEMLQANGGVLCSRRLHSGWRMSRGARDGAHVDGGGGLGSELLHGICITPQPRLLRHLQDISGPPKKRERAITSR